MPQNDRKRAQVLSIVLFVLKAILPRAVRDEYLAELQDLCPEGVGWARQSIDTVGGAYKNQIIVAFDVLTIGVQMTGMAYCLSAAGVPAALAAVLGGVLAPLTLRTAYTHLFDRKGNLWMPKSPWQYSMDSVADAVYTTVTVLLYESLMVMISPQLAMKPDPMFRGLALGVPALTAMRMAMRPRAPFHMPFKHSKITAEQMYKRVRWMNLLWIYSFQYIILANPDFLPSWIPAADFLSTFIPAKLFIYWMRVQQNPLIRRDKIETAFGPHWAKKLQARRRERLMKGVARGQQFYYAYIGLQVLIFAWAAIPAARALWPWLSGDVANWNDYEFAYRLVLWGSLLCSWDFLKRANRAAADAVQQDIDSDRIPDEIPIWMRVWNRFPRFLIASKETRRKDLWIRVTPC